MIRTAVSRMLLATALQRGSQRRASPGAARWLIAGCLPAIIMVAWAQPSAAEVQVTVAAAVADFDNMDTSGESSERAAAHALRVQAFAAILRDTLDAEDKFEVVALKCPRSPCSPTVMPPAKFIESAQDSGARLIIYGGIQKMSTLVQIGFIQAVDLKTDKLVFNQAITFRGDTDEAFRRAADFVADYLKNVAFKP